ncbi:Ubiquitin carboxyl-terminal hydrolase 12 [Morus notabilis]|uniref:Ubiquitin carboxyl-terminal hydrolase 12 n=1 Tax=Morus notabilis TaxID=981085 RepID=W9QI11_9ROSA|nr:Ubiquitin carboxyl-terminal hydrolase 12 [Morus notabilis]
MVTKQFLASLWRRLYYYSSSNSNDTESNDLAILKAREAKPSHHLLKIESFNKLSENLSSPYIAEEFTAGGYTWLLCIHLQGDEENDGKNHVSIYLEVADTTDLPDGWEINATFNFFVYDQIRDKYVGLQGSGLFYSSRYTDPSSTYGDCILEGETEHHKSPYFISLAELQDPKLGYLINDTCILEAEINILAMLHCLSDR